MFMSEFIVSQLIGVLVGAVIGSLIGALFIQLVTRWVCRFSPSYGMAYKACFITCIVNYIIAVVISFATARSTQQVQWMTSVMTMFINFFIASALYGMLIKKSDILRPIGFGKGCLINLMLISISIFISCVIGLVLIPVLQHTANSEMTPPPMGAMIPLGIVAAGLMVLFVFLEKRSKKQVKIYESGEPEESQESQY